MTLGLTQPLTEMSTRNIFWGGGKVGWCVGLTTLAPSCVDCRDSGSLNHLVASWSAQAYDGIPLPFTILYFRENALKHTILSKLRSIILA